MIITGGTLEFGRVVKPADYESKAAKVILSFGVDDGEDAEATIERVKAMAMRHALEMVGAKAAEPASAAQPEKPKRAPRVAPVDPTPPSSTNGSESDGPKKSADPAAIEEVERAEAAAVIAEAPVKISDKDLADACARKSEAKGAEYDVQAVRKLITSFAPRLSLIPAEHRQKFLDDLKAL